MAQPTISDIIEIEQLLARYAVGMTQDDVESVMDGVFTPDGTYSAFGSTYQLHDFPGWSRPLPKDCSSSARRRSTSTAIPEPATSLCCLSTRRTTTCAWGGTPTATPRTKNGWRLRTRSMTFLRRSGGRDAGRPHDPTRPEPTEGEAQ